MTLEEAKKVMEIARTGDLKAFNDAVIQMLDDLPTMLDKIRAEIEQMPSELTTDGRRMVRRVNVFRIIDKYRGVEE